MITRPRLAACLAGFLRLGWSHLSSISGYDPSRSLSGVDPVWWTPFPLRRGCWNAEESPAIRAGISELPPVFPLRPKSAVLPIENLAVAAAGLGHATVAYDRD